ncbi:MAG: M56 family metallopeptidase [Clostridia bacterium]
MSNIWEFLFFSFDLSLWALVILALKRVFKGRLSPNWQYNVWGIFIVKSVFNLLSGVNYLNSSFSLIKLIMKLETSLGSSFTSAYQSFSYTDFYFGAPTSITDWLFVIYVLGAAVLAIYYILQYVKLRHFIKSNACEVADKDSLITNIGVQNSLKTCKTVYVDGIKAPFLCGIIKPIIVLPKDMILDEKIILHELIHLKYKHNLQNVLWCALRCLNWCNPFLFKVFNSITNDIEISCDQKVLEKLEGEDLREYGKTLLFMADEKFSKVVGTTSISNGGENIKKRIESIVFFKKYPKDLKLVTYCISAILIFMIATSSILYNAVFSVEADDYSPTNMSIASTFSAKTDAAAIDIFVKGLINKSFDLLAIVSPSDKVSDVIDSSIAYKNDGCPADFSYFLSSPIDEYAEDCLNTEMFEEKTPPVYEVTYSFLSYELIEATNGWTYNVYNPIETENGFSGTLIIFIYEFDECALKYSEDKIVDEYSTGALVIPFEVYAEDDGDWVFEQTGDYEIVRAVTDFSIDDIELTENCYTQIQSMQLQASTQYSLYLDHLNPEISLVCENEYGSGFLVQYVTYEVNDLTNITNINAYKNFDAWDRNVNLKFEFDKEIGSYYPYYAKVEIASDDSVSSTVARGITLEDIDDIVYYSSGGGFSQLGAVYVSSDNNKIYTSASITITDGFNEVIDEFVFKEVQ